MITHGWYLPKRMANTIATITLPTKITNGNLIFDISSNNYDVLMQMEHNIQNNNEQQQFNNDMPNYTNREDCQVLFQSDDVLMQIEQIQKEEDELFSMPRTKEECQICFLP